MRNRQESGRFSWLARVLASYVAGGYMVEGENTAVASAQKIAMDEIEAVLLGAAPAEPKNAEPPTGSFERLTTFFNQKKD